MQCTCGCYLIADTDRPLHGQFQKMTSASEDVVESGPTPATARPSQTSSQDVSDSVCDVAAHRL